jgi:hypothetical protein
MMVEMSDDVGELLSVLFKLEALSCAWESPQPKQC